MPIDPRLNPAIVEKFINKTIEHKSIKPDAQYMNLFPERLRADLKFLYEKTKDTEFVKQFNSTENIKKFVLDFYSKMGEKAFFKVDAILNNRNGNSLNININENSLNTSRIEKSASNPPKIITNVNLTLDAQGAIALTQAVSNAIIAKDHFDAVNEEELRKENFSKQATKMFVTSMMIDHLTKESMLNDQQKDYLQLKALTEISSDVRALNIDKQIFDEVFINNPNMQSVDFEKSSPEHIYRIIKEWMKKENSDAKVKSVTDRIIDIAENGRTTDYLKNNIRADLWGLSASLENQDPNIHKDKYTQEAYSKTLDNIMKDAPENSEIRNLPENSREIISRSMPNSIKYQDLVDEDENVMIRYKKKELIIR